MKTLQVLLVLSCTSLVLANTHQEHGLISRHEKKGGVMQILRKRQQAAGGVGGDGDSTSQASTPGIGVTSQAASPSDPAAPAVASSAAPPPSSNNNSPLDSLTQALTSPSTSSSSSSQAQPPTSEEEQQTRAANDPATSSSSSSQPPASSTSQIVPSSIAANPRSTGSASQIPPGQSTSIIVVTPSGSSTLSDSTSSASASAANSQKDSSSSSGGLPHGTLIAIIVVASCIAGVGAIWTIVRKTKFSPSKRFESKLEPIDFVPEVPSYSNQQHNRSQSQLSGAYGGGAGYAESLARSDSKGSMRGNGMNMSESGHNLASIPYAGPGYVQQPYYGSAAPHSPQLGYPHEQPTYYPSLQRGASSSSSLQQQAQLGRMNTMASNAGGGMGYDYAAQARAQSRQGNGGQYY